MRTRIVSLATTLLLLAAGSGAEGRAPCVSYSVTAPMVGTEADTECSPVHVPPSFTGTLQHTECYKVPPAGVEVCAGFYLPTYSP